MNTTKNGRSTDKTKARYDRIAWMYDLSEYFVESLAFRRWRRRLWSQVPSGNGLEVGVGTGKNIPYYPPEARVTAVDLSPKMLKRARRRANRTEADVELMEMNAERLEFPDNTFDWAVATFVFCSIPSPVHALRELSRVVKPDGRIYLLEHVRIDRPVLGRLMDIFNPIAVRLSGANINRQTVKNVEASGLTIERLENLGPFGVAKLIIAGPAPDKFEGGVE